LAELEVGWGVPPVSGGGSTQAWFTSTGVVYGVAGTAVTDLPVVGVSA
jgi:hypothetical protein